MKTKKNRDFKKNLSFYRINFKFSQPYQLILDGNFIKVMDEKNVDIDKQFYKYCKQSIWKHTTLCVLRELQNLQHLFPKAYQRAQKLSKIDCKHIEGVSPSECFKDLVSVQPEFKGQNNFYWICTQDEDLRRELTQIEYVPVCYLFQNNLLELIEPSKFARKKVKQGNESKYKPNEMEMKKIISIKQEVKKEEAKKRMKKERQIAKELQIKVKKPAKGPNPLSMKKKKIRKQIRKCKRRHKIKFKKTRRILKTFTD